MGFSVRDDVLRILEEARVQKVIGSSLEAQVTITAEGETLELLRRHEPDLRYLFIVSQVCLREPDDETSAVGSSVVVKIDRARGEKCDRCWNYSVRVGESSRYPNVCERCVEALEEIESKQ